MEAERHQAAILQAVAVATAILGIDLVSGSFSPEEEIPLIGLMFLLAMLHS